MTKVVTTVNAAATQTEHPWRATVRTFVQTLIPSLALFVLAVPPVVDIVLDEVGRAGVELPGWAFAALTGLSVGCALVAAVVARVMAVPGVERLLRGTGLSAAPNEVDVDGASFDDPSVDVVEEVDVTPVPDGYQPKH